MMRVVYVLNSTYRLGGASKSFLSMLQGLMHNGVSPIVVVPDAGGICEDLAALGIRTIVLDYRPGTYPYYKTWKDLLLFVPRLMARRVLDARAVKKLSDILSRQSIDLIHTNVSVVDIGFRLSRRLRIPHVYHVREYGDLDFGDHYYPSWKRYHKRMYVSDSYTICITRDIQRHHSLVVPSSRVIYNGISPMASGFERFVGGDCFLFAGRIEPAKGLMELLQAYALYCEQNESVLPLLVAGEVSDSLYGEEVFRYVADHGLSGQVHFLGLRKDMARLMQKAKALVVPSRFEAFGRCMAEAMFNGCLVIGRNTGGTKEQFDNGLRIAGVEIGFRYNTTVELTACLKTVAGLSAGEEAVWLQRAGKVVNQLYSVNANVTDVYEFYKEIVHEKNR